MIKDKETLRLKCKNEFVANDIDIWIDGGLKCPVCGAKSTDINYLGKAIENGQP